MTALARPLALVALSALTWLVVAAQVPGSLRLPIQAVVPGAVLTQRFGCTSVTVEPVDPRCLSHHFHSGVDLAARLGTPIHSATSGVVETGYDSRSAGSFVVVVVDSRTRILYCHLAAFRVRPGDVVSPGEVIGLVGESGLATGPHVHLEVQVGGRATDPVAWLAP